MNTDKCREMFETTLWEACENSKYSVVVFGPQGCGKTINARRLAEYFGLPHIVDEADSVLKHPDQIKQNDVLYLAQMRPKLDVTNKLRVFSFSEAIANIQG